MASALSQVSKQDLLAALDTSRKRLKKVVEDNAEAVSRTTNVGVGVIGGGAGAWLDKKWAGKELAGMSLPLTIGGAATFAGLFGYGGQHVSEHIASFGAGMLAWEFGKFMYARADGPSAQPGSVGAAPALAPPAHHAPAHLPAPAAAPVAPRFQPPTITLDDLHRQWSLMAAAG